MKFWATTAFALLIGLFASHRPRPKSGDGWTQLFDGKTVPALDSVGPGANWRVENGELVADKLSADKGTNHLLTKEKYKDFQIHLEFWSDEKVNSGLFIRCQDPKSIGAKNCYEVNIFDGARTRPTAPARSCISPRSTRCRRRPASGTPWRSPPRAARSS